MSDDRRGPDDDRALFERAMEDVQRIEDRDRAPRRRPPRRRQPRRERRPVEFRLELYGETVEGLARGENLRLLGRLRRGDWPVERRLDLHGHTREEARFALRAALVAAERARERCVLVIHGRGLGSEEGPVLKRALPGWLAEPPHGKRVRAFVTPAPPLGGAGATLVLLRRHRA